MIADADLNLKFLSTSSLGPPYEWIIDPHGLFGSILGCVGQSKELHCSAAILHEIHQQLRIKALLPTQLEICKLRKQDGLAAGSHFVLVAPSLGGDSKQLAQDRARFSKCVYCQRKRSEIPGFYKELDDAIQAGKRLVMFFGDFAGKEEAQGAKSCAEPSTFRRLVHHDIDAIHTNDARTASELKVSGWVLGIDNGFKEHERDPRVRWGGANATLALQQPAKSITAPRNVRILVRGGKSMIGALLSRVKFLITSIKQGRSLSSMK